MLGSAVLELGLGLIFVYLLLSLIASAIGTKVSDWLEWRARDLENGLRNLVLNGDWESDQLFVAQKMYELYVHPAVRALAMPTGPVTRALQQTPMLGKLTNQAADVVTHIPPRTFVLTLLEVLAPGTQTARTVDELRQAIQAMPDTRIRQTLLTIITGGEASIEAARNNVETWFNGVMERVSELYKAHMRQVALAIGLAVALILNVDTVSVANSLWRDPSLRAGVAAAATHYVDTAGNTTPSVGDIQKQFADLKLPIGWQVLTSEGKFAGLQPLDWTSPFSTTNAFLGALVLKLVGWIVSGLAAAQGAPFWYDLLKKIASRG